jgi:hypothetical protein
MAQRERLRIDIGPTRINQPAAVRHLPLFNRRSRIEPQLSGYVLMSSGRDCAKDFVHRRSERLSVASEAQLRHQWYSVEITVCDVSQTGFMAECEEAVAIGSHVTLDVPGIGPVRAQVRWQIGGRMGGMFLDPISLTECGWTAVRAQPESLSA